MTRTTILLLSALLISCGITDDPVSSPEPGFDVREQPDTSPPVFTSGEPPDFTSGNPLATSVIAKIVPVDRGLFDAAPAASPQTAVAIQSGTQRFDVELGPGAWGIVVSDGDERVLDTRTTTGDLQSVSGDLTEAAFFNPTHGQFTFVVEFGNDEFDIRAQRTSDGTEIAFDDSMPATRAGRWFDETFAEVASGERPADALIEEIYDHGGPFVTKHGVLFIAEFDAGSATPVILGSWNDFVPEKSNQLRPIGPGVAARFIQIRPSEHVYTVFNPTDQTANVDPCNRHVSRVDGGDFGSALFGYGPRTVWLKTGGKHDVFVRLPGGYSADARPFPTMYVHDGRQSYLDGQFDRAVDDVSSLTATLQTVTVFIDDGGVVQRMRSDTSTVDGYVDHVADSVVPMIEATFNVRTDRRGRGTAGAGYGGVTSYWAALQHAEVFGYTAGISAAVGWNGSIVIEELVMRGCQDVVYHVATGEEVTAATMAMRDTLDMMGCDYGFVADHRGDGWDSRRERFANVLLDFGRVHGR